MYTYQDLLAIGEDKEARIQFVLSAIHDHKASDDYKQSVIAYDYYRQRNTTIMEYQKLLYTISGQAVPDNYSANYKICSNFFNHFVTQEAQFLLGNGVNWEDDNTGELLGDDFDIRLQELGTESLISKVAFGFWNYDHLEIFNLREFKPFYDEENGALMAGIRFWQIDDSKPLRATLYEPDGYTDFLWTTRRNSESMEETVGEILHEKRTYIQIAKTSEVDGTKIYDGENYEGFPIIPLWGNPARQSELVGIRQGIDAYDLIKSGFANDLDDASMIYWTIQNAGGMDDIDLVNFVNHMKTVKAAVVEDTGARAESHTMDVPYASREALLNRLRSDLFDDYMALDTKNLANGAVTATQIKAAYEPLNAKADLFEYQILDFLQGLFEIVGLEDNPTFTRSMIINTNEEIQVILQASEYLPQSFVTERIATILGAVDQLEDIKAQMEEEDIDRMGMGEEDLLAEESEEIPEEGEDLAEGEEFETEDIEISDGEETADLEAENEELKELVKQLEDLLKELQ